MLTIESNWKDLQTEDLKLDEKVKILSSEATHTEIALSKIEKKFKGYFDLSQSLDERTRKQENAQPFNDNQSLFNVKK